jgi:NAD+ synthase (glutamine-hydrolysing)
MKNYGFIRAAASTAANRAGDIRFNTSVAKTVIDEAHEKGVSILVFPELFLTGCTCGDLFRQTLMLKEAEDSVSEIAEYSKGKNVSVIIGIPVPYSSRLYNCAVVINDGRIAGLVPKTYVPAAERRWIPP